MLSHVSLVCLASLLCSTVIHAEVTLNEVKFNKIVDKLESDALEFASKVEELYSDRCVPTTLKDCAVNNFADCLSEFPSQTCPGGDTFSIPQCGDGITCSGLFDFTVSTVSVPYENVDISHDYNPTDPKTIETVCFTRQLDQWFQTKRNSDYNYWQELAGEQPLGMYFGSDTGVFRIYPARHSDSCNTFDPTLRPWYVAASSGPKNVIMVLDTSGSMDQNGKLGLLKEAAHRVVNTLAVGDLVALVTFNSDASGFTSVDGTLFQAAEANKVILNKTIDALEAKGRTNFYAGFQKAFEIITNSIESEQYVNCNTAILFLTDGVMTEPNNMTQQQVVDYVIEGLHDIETQTQHPVLLFTYSIAGDSGVELFPKQLACAADRGVWTDIQRPGDIANSLSSYYRLFSLGLGSESNRNFTAWVEPYIYRYGGVLGTTVSAPVFDRSKQPPVFIGVVGVGFAMATLNAALGTNDSEVSLKRLVDISTPNCPALDLSVCELESYRREAGGDDALCTSNCTVFVDTTAQHCLNLSDQFYPTNLWQNVDNKDKAYGERVCCKVGMNTTSDQCPATNEDHVGAIVGGVVGGFLGVCVAVYGIIWYCGKQDTDDSMAHAAPSAPSYEQSHLILERPPPTNPHIVTATVIQSQLPAEQPR